MMALLLAAVLLAFVVERAADALNLRALDPELPPAFRGVFDAARYRRAQEYTRARIVFGAVVTTVEMTVLVGFWVAGGFGWLDHVVRGLGYGPIPTGLLFVGALVLGQLVLGLPARWWSTFVIEERFGFNRTTPAVFWIDTIKGMALAVGLGGPFLATVLWLFAHAGPTAWLWCWLVGAAVVVGVQFVAPAWLMPMFYRFTPLDDGTLRDAILGYARDVGFPLEGVFVIDGSRRSTKANAFFTGFGRHKRIALFDTLLRTLDRDEIVAVVAHEVGHYRRGHVRTGLAMAIAQLGVIFGLLALALPQQALFDAFRVSTPSVAVGLVLFLIALTPINLVLSVGMQALSRRHEREADAFASETTKMPARLRSALERLAADSLANLTPHPLYVALNHSHPPLAARVAALAG